MYVIGFLAQAFFSARILIQWVASERAKRVESPLLFWVCSMVGAWLFLVYGWMRDDFSIILGQCISYYIYVWNINAKGYWRRVPWLLRAVLVLSPVAAMAFVAHNGADFVQSFFRNDDIPLLLVLYGSLGQTIFSLRFVYQYLYSRRSGTSQLPLGFWVMCLVGSSIIITYAIARLDPVLILGQSFGFVSYIRNIVIGRRETRRTGK